jgi:isopenicillin N synthase-like dioxygenase
MLVPKLVIQNQKSMPHLHKIPVINLARLQDEKTATSESKLIREACIQHGFFYISHHGISKELQNKIYQLSNDFFALPLEEKMKVSMQLGGRAWRGFFPVGAELTSGKPDAKEGIYFGTELTPEHPEVQSGTPLHGANLFPKNPSELKEVVLEWMQQVEQAGHIIMEGIALSLGLPKNYFDLHFTKNPLILFRIFHYPPTESHQNAWGVGEHTDYGLLTILKQDHIGGLQIKSHGKWIDAPPIEDTFVCNIGDMLDHLTGGLYKSTPHRVVNTSGKSRLSFPLFFDPNFKAPIQKIEGLNHQAIDDSAERWDKSNVHQFNGTYGEYLLKKIGNVFPDLKNEVL